jgi:Uma2 family endonuclease
MATVPAKRRPPRYDPTVYPSEDHMGEGSLQRFISEVLRILVEHWLEKRGEIAFVGASQFIYWRQFDPSRKLAPDVFVLPGVKPGIKIDSWKTWETGIVPSFAFEVVSQDYLKDYRDAPEPYAELGVSELVIFDPEYELQPAERLRWQVYRRLERRGFVRVAATNADRLRSSVLGCWLRAVGHDLDSLRLRLATGRKGDSLIPTAEEAERETREAEQAARLRAEAEVERLRAELDSLRRAKPGA